MIITAAPQDLYRQEAGGSPRNQTQALQWGTQAFNQQAILVSHISCPGKAADDDPRAWVPATHMEYLGGVPGS